MPRRTITRRRGKGTPTYRAKSHRYRAKVEYKTYEALEKEGKVIGEVVDLMHDPARNAPLMIVKYDTQITALPAVLGIKKGDIIEEGVTASIREGNILPLAAIPEGTTVSNIELRPGDGGALVRTAGSSAKIVRKDEKEVVIKLPSKKFKALNKMCRAMIGVIAGGGHKEKPLLKAGKNYYKKKARGKLWPIVSGTSKNPVEHPHGGGGGRSRKSRTVSRNAPPGAKVGTIASRRTGRRKK